MKDPGEEEREENEVNAEADMSEDFPVDAPPAEKTPKLPTIPVEDGPKRDGKGMEKALEQLEEYDDGVPPHNPDVQHHEE